MELSYTVVLVLGFCHAVGAIPSFDKTDETNIRQQLSQAKEVDGNLPTVNQRPKSLGFLRCTDGNLPTKVTTTDTSFVTVNAFKNVFLKPLDYEEIVKDQDTQNNKKIKFQCTSSTGAAEVTMTLVVVDVNDNAPLFQRSNATYSVEINEFLDEKQIIYNRNSPNPILVTDADGTDNNRVEAECLRMRLDSGQILSCDGYFKVEAQPDGFGRYYFTIAAEKLDYSGEKSFTLEIRAVNKPLGNDTAQGTLFSTTQNVAINIRDVQNLPPLIDKDALSFEMLENLTVGSQLVGYIGAFDQDIGDPHAIRFVLERPFSDNPRDYYAFDHNKFALGDVILDGIMYKVPLLLNNSVDREEIIGRTKTLYLGIKAIEYDLQNRPDRNTGTASDTVSINILDVNDQMPQFSGPTYDVEVTELSDFEADANPENYRQISNNVEIEVTDTDSSDYNKFTVSIVSGNQLGNFKLDDTAGSEQAIFNIYAKQKILDYEKDPKQYVLELVAVDTNNPSFRTSATVSISIININDHSPEFNQAVALFNVKENATVNTPIGSVIATDKDDDNFGIISRYQITGDDTPTFRIDNQGRITLQGSLDYEIRDAYYFTVRAYDTGNLEGSINVNVQVDNVFDIALRFLATYSATLEEDKLDLTPSIIVQAESRETDAPPVQYFVAEVTPSTVPQNSFSIGSSSGELSVVNYVSYDDTSDSEPGIVRVKIGATSGGLTSYTTVVVEIINVNNYAPEFQPVVADNTYYTSINESAAKGVDVYALTVRDLDGPNNENGQVTFQLQSGANDDFFITADTGIIKVSESSNLDADGDNRPYTIVIVARDKGLPPLSATATVIVTLLDTNDEIPEFKDPLYRFRIKADDPPGTLIGQVTATDVDSTSKLDYSIDYTTVEFLKQTGPIQVPIDATEVIKIDPEDGQLRVAGNINRELYNRINLYVRVRDLNADKNLRVDQTTTAFVIVFIYAPTDPRIYFTNDQWTRDSPFINVTFTESRSINYQIVALRATDPSIPETVQIYRKKEGSDPDDYFEVRDASVFVKKPLDYEELPPGNKELSVTVVALSRDLTKNTTATVNVKVLDLNDNAPVFEVPVGGFNFSVAEDMKAPHVVGRIKATDRDSSSYGEVEYSISGDQTNFGIYMERSGNENIGVIFVAENADLDYETNKLYNLVVVATDNPGGTNTVRFATNIDVVIDIEDRNDMSPVFDEEVYNITIIGTKEVNEEVFFIKATDGDAGVNGLVTYSIVNATNDGRRYFSIKTDDQSSDRPGEFLRIGQLYVISSLKNLPDRSVYMLTVAAQDMGSPVTPPGLCKVFITVSKGVQDLKPKWAEDLPARVKISENEPPNTSVATLTAYPADVTSSIIYTFVGAGDALRDYDSFTINPNNGEIKTKVALDYEEQIIYSLLILGTDSENDTLTNQYLLIVEVLDVDDNQPSFVDCPGKQYSVPEMTNVDEELPPPVNVYRAEACDLDSAPLNQVKYSWFINNDYCPDNTEIFSLNQNNGQIYTKDKLDRERLAEYMLCIEASRPNVPNTEKSLNALNNTNKLLFVKVNVKDVNDEGPRFDKPSVKTVILQYPEVNVGVAEATDSDLPPNNGIRYLIDNIDFTKNGKTQNAPTAFRINANDGTVVIDVNDYTDYVGGYFDINIKAEDYNNANVPYDHQLLRVYVTDRSNRIRVVFNKPADAVVNKAANDMINELNALYEDSGMFYEIETISYHVISNNADPSFDKTDVCIVVVEDDQVLSSASAAKRLTDVQNIRGILNKYGAVDPGSCDPAVSVYPVGWESYWWVLVAFAIFIFVCCLILILLICVLYRQYKQYMDSRKTYLVPGN
ncbi:cadherin-23-like isoform X2 [Mercenaria mercenaria]|uniref:cadherin-23-like isoform X2 n=1 Tax=Mercenaria mercenaria TaxID=6596 RepID=UPI00234F0D3D|nr:cadherin-23-like isoform X2 [Mercenaria mercenaria]